MRPETEDVHTGKWVEIPIICKTESDKNAFYNGPDIAFVKDAGSNEKVNLPAQSNNIWARRITRTRFSVACRFDCENLLCKQGFLIHFVGGLIHDISSYDSRIDEAVPSISEFIDILQTL